MDGADSRKCSVLCRRVEQRPVHFGACSSSSTVGGDDVEAPIRNATVKRVLRSCVYWYTIIWGAVYLPLETYVSFSNAPVYISWYTADVLGAVVMFWGAIGLRRGKAYAEGLLIVGWSWTTAIFWRATNLRFWFSDQGEPLQYGQIELVLGPTFTLMAAAGLVVSLVLVFGSHGVGAKLRKE